MATAIMSTEEMLEDAKGLGCAKEYFKEYEEVYKIIDSVRTVSSNAQQSEVTLNRFWYILNQYQEQPHLLDPHLENLLSKLLAIVRTSNHNVQHLAFKCLYVISKVRSYKVIVRYMPHEVTDLPFIMDLLSQQDPLDNTTWQTRYMLLLWLSIVVMIPFHMSRMDAVVEGSTGEPMMKRILDVIKFYLCSLDSPAKAAVILSGRFLTRPDSVSSELKEFIDWTQKSLSVAKADTKHQLIAALANLFKYGKREDLIPFSSSLLYFVLESKFLESNITLVRKMAMKLVQRIGLAYLKVRVSPWRYNRGTRSLSLNLVLASDSESKIMQMSDEEYDIPDELEEIMGFLLNGLRDLEFSVRWSAAKGLGRVTGRLPKEMADDVVVSILDLFVPREAERSWHGGCIALAELGRRGLLLPQHLDRVIPVVKKALVFDENKGNFSVGSYIRDAACYVCWSFARAYDPPVLQPYMKDIAQSLLITAIFDREVSCRRAASAAIQENVGRQGTFPNGIDIVTTVDYSSVALMAHTFLELSVEMAKFEDYTISLIDHLCLLKFNHWDIAVRKLASQALGKLTAFAPEYICRHIIPNILPQVMSIDSDARHGAVLVLAEIVAALGNLKSDSVRECFGESDFEKMSQVIREIDQKKLFRGINGELMRESSCVLIESWSKVCFLPVGDWKNLDLWQELLMSWLQNSKLSVQMESANALAQFCKTYLVAEHEKQKNVLELCISQLNASQQTTRIGFALALGSLPKLMLECHEERVLAELIKCATIANSEQASFVESRRTSIGALMGVIVTLGVQNLNAAQVRDVFERLLLSTTEHVNDVNGDIANVVRKPALASLRDLVLLLMDANPNLLTLDIVKRVICSFLHHCVGLVEDTRVLAIKIVQQLIWRSPEIPGIPHKEELQAILSPTVCDIMDIRRALDTFPIFVKVLDLREYTYPILLGLTFCIGSKNGYLIKHSQSAFQGYFNSRKVDLSHLCDCFLRIHHDNSDDPRLVVPFLKTADFLLFCGAFDSAEQSFLGQLFDLSMKLASMSKNVFRVMALEGVLSGMLQSEATRVQALSALVKMLYHQYVAVRKLAAEKLYEAILGGCEIVDDFNLDRALELLGETNWAANKREDIKPAHLAIKGMLRCLS